MAAPSGKTRTTSAHGPASVKKPYKAPSKPTTRPSNAPSTTPKPTASKPRAAFDSPKPVGGYGMKRKAEEEANPNKAAEKERPMAPSSLLNLPEEIDFPRGGGTNLTQVEVREAQLEGEKEAREEEEGDRERELNVGVGKDKSKSKRRKLERELLGAKIDEKNKLPKDAFRVEHLNYKRLIPSTKVLAQIILVRPLELIVSLPNQLLAHIPITSISPEYTERLEAAGEDSDDDDEEEDESESEEEEDEDDEDETDEVAGGKPKVLSSSAANKAKDPGFPLLSMLFKEGMWVSAVVVKSLSMDSKMKLGGREGDENVRASRRIELSLEPEKVNEGIVKGDLRAGFTLTGSIKSIEDHGYIVSLGLPTVTAFLPFKEAKKLQPKRMEVGQLVTCRVKELAENGRTCTVTVGRAEVIGSTLSSATSITSILPSHLVICLVTACLASGLNVKFFGYFDGSIDLFHLGGLDPEKDFKVGQKIKARIMWDSVGTSPKKFSLSLAKQVMTLGVATFEKEDEEAGTAETESIEERFPVGRILEVVKVVRMDDEWGLTCEIEDEGTKVAAFVHISRITDDHLASIPKAGPWKVGTLHRGRVIGYSAVDGLVQLSLQPLILAQSFLRVSDVQVGEVIKGTIKRLGDSALFVSISGNVDGVVWPMHYADIMLKHPEKKFKAGASIKARIFSADPIKNRVVLTLKRQLINSELPIVTSLEDAKVGVVTHGTVTKVMEKGVLVDFFGGMRALIPAGEAAEGFTADLSRVFTVGKVIPVRIISVDPSTSKIVASAKQALSSFTKVDEITKVEIGTVLSGEISALHESNIILALLPTRVKALMSYATLARHRKTTVEALRSDLVKGQNLDDLVVVSKNVEKGFVIVGLVPSKAKKTEEEASPSTSTNNTLTIESLSAGQLVSGRICGKVPTGLLVQVSKTIRAKVSKPEIGDDYEQIDGPSVAIGTHVSCYVLSVDVENHRVELSLRRSRLEEGAVVKDVAVSSVGDLAPGQMIRGFVKNIANQGVFVSLGADITARVLIKELFDEFVKDWKPKFQVGQLVEGKITAVDKVSNQVELSLRKNATTKEASIEYSDLVKGQVVRGVVKRVEAYGAFIRIDGSNISGLCHRSKVTDDESTAWTEFVRENDEVKAVILDINVETKKISLALKPSLFPEGAEDDDDDVEEGEEDEDEDDEDEGGDEVEEMEGEEGEDESEDDDDGARFSAQFDSGGDSDVEMEIKEPIASTSKLPSVPIVKAPPLAVSTGFNWDGEAPDEDAPAAEDVDSDSDEEAVLSAGDSDSKKPRQDVEDRTGDLATQAPTSLADFERLLLGSPNSSYVWIQFIAYYLGLSQVDKAREISRRALKTINFRAEEEKLNVWVAMLNLENSYGTETTLDALFKEAIQANDAKTVYLRLVDIYERAGKFEAEEELFQKLVKKFGQSSKAWTLFGQFYLTRGKAAEARELLPRSLKSLEKRKHIKTIAKFAQLEFKLGDAERGRTIFEGIMDSVPKRLDLWFVYVDMEIKQRNTAGVRALFSRILVQKLSSKKGKSVFKKWLAFEKEHGDDAGVQVVKERAMAFVEALGQ